MLTITHSLRDSKSIKKKGQQYVMMYIKSPNWSKPLRPTHNNIMFFKRADTAQKKSQNKKSKQLLDAVYKEYQEKYKGAEYSDAQTGTITLKKQITKMSELKADKSESTMSGYHNLYVAMEKFCKAKGHNFNMDINRVNIQFIDQWRLWLTTGSNYAQSTAYKYFTLFSTTLKQAKSYGLLFYNPFTENKIEFPKNETKEVVYLTPDEVTMMIQTPTKYEQIKNAFLFMCYVGIRQGDCCRLTWGDLPEINGVVKMNVRTQKAKTDIYFKIRKQAMKYLPKRMGNDDSVFPSLKFGKEQNQKLREWAYKSGVKKHIVPHTARHSFAFYMLSENNTPLYTVSKLMGHTNARTTEERYGHLSNENIELAMEKAFGS